AARRVRRHARQYRDSVGTNEKRELLAGVRDRDDGGTGVRADARAERRDARPMSAPVRLADLTRCFQGIIPAMIATSDAHGMPNVPSLTQIYGVDERPAAPSRHFFKKPSRNLDENPHACVEACDPLTMQAYRFRLRFIRSETAGPLFDCMKLR